MDNNHLLKITYHSGTKKINVYLKKPSAPIYHNLKKEIEDCFFEERKHPRCEIRLFWIDEDLDEIEIVNQYDFSIYMATPFQRRHLHVAPVRDSKEEQSDAATSTESATNQSKIPPADGSYDFAVHEHVECDACLMAPIIGFRYKCIQCPNYDICQNCEAKHTHSEHMMVRMPTNNCPNVVEAYVTGRTSRRHGKRSKPSCPFVKNGLSVVIDDETESAGATGGESADQATAANGKERHHGRKHHRRHHRNNFFSHLYEMMHDLAEGGGAEAADQAMDEPKSAKTSTGPQATTKGNAVAAAAAAAAAHLAAQSAHETAIKTAEIAAKVAHETAAQAAKNNAENTATPQSSASAPTATAAVGENDERKNEATKEKETEPKADSDPVYEHIVHLLDPQYVKTGIQILNNFSDIFAKMLEPMDNAEVVGDNQIVPDKNKTSNTSTEFSKFNGMETHKKSLNEQTIDTETNSEQTEETKQPETDASSNVAIDDLGSESENDSVSESFIKLDVPKDDYVSASSTSPSTGASAQNTPPQSLNKSNVMDFAKLSADLEAHIAEEAVNAEKNTATDAVDNANEQVITTSNATSNSNITSGPNRTEEKRAVLVYHADDKINRSVHAMMAMGFSNEGAWLTQLLESVNGNIAEALDLMSAAQRSGSH